MSVAVISHMHAGLFARLLQGCAAILLVGCEVQFESPPDQVEPAIEDVVSAPVSRKEIEIAFSRSDATDIVFALNEVKKSALNFDVIEVVACAYISCDRRSEAWNEGALSEETVRVHLVNVLVQANHRGIPTIEENELLDETLEFLSSRNPLVVQEALFTLAYVGDPAYVPMIAKVAEETDSLVTFRVAIRALQRIGDETALAHMQDVLKAASEEQRAAVADFISLE